MSEAGSQGKGSSGKEQDAWRYFKQDAYQYPVGKSIASDAKPKIKVSSICFYPGAIRASMSFVDQDHPREEDAMENLARYIIRASFSQERMTHIREESKVMYKSKDGRQQKAFDALEWLAAMSSHIPDKGEHMVRYYGYYSNVCRGRRQKEDQDGLIAYIIEQEENLKEYRKNWARLIRKIYEVDPLTCPKCQGTIKVVGFIEDKDVIKKILKPLGIWLVKKKPSAGANAPPIHINLDYSDSQIPSFEGLYKDPDYPTETYTS